MDKDSKIWTVIELVKWGTSYFDTKGVDSPRLTIELLLCSLLGCPRIKLYTSFDRPLKETELNSLREMVRRRAAREPLQYITGKTNFMGQEINLTNYVLIPRPETEQLTELVFASVESKKSKARILDIGTGSGCIAIALAVRFPETEILAVDYSEKILEVAKSNARQNNIENIKFQLFDIFDDATKLGKFDIIVSNPPYIPSDEYLELEPEVRKFEPEKALTDNGDGFAFYRRFSEIFSEMLNENGHFFLEIGYNQSPKIKKIFGEKGFEIAFRQDFTGFDRFACYGDWRYRV